MKPIILSEKKHTLLDLNKLRKESKIWEETDHYSEQLEELFQIEHPSAKLSKDYELDLKKFVDSRLTTAQGKFCGTWTYFPWSGRLAHILNEEEYLSVRTSRNKNIINGKEQKKLFDFSVSILGLSIGNGMALSLAYSSISNKMKIADFDTLELSNLNRVRSSVSDLGLEKSQITSHQIYEINPYAQLDIFSEGLNKENLTKFVEGSNLIFEAIDDFEMKIRVRFEAKKLKVPVIMLTNLGDRLLIDVERYDLDPNLEIFNGLIGSIAEEILSQPIKEEDKQRYAVAIVGKENIPSRVIETISEINKTLVGRPQVMSTVTIGGGLAAYLTRRVALGKLNSGRYLIDFESLIANKNE